MANQLTDHYQHETQLEAARSRQYATPSQLIKASQLPRVLDLERFAPVCWVPGVLRLASGWNSHGVWLAGGEIPKGLVLVIMLQGARSASIEADTF